MRRAFCRWCWAVLYGLGTLGATSGDLWHAIAVAMLAYGSFDFWFAWVWSDMDGAA